jgi:hypothetical protein
VACLAATLAALLAFAISNLSWFAFSGHYPAAALADFVQRMLPQAPRYVGVVLAWAGLGLLARSLLGARAAAAQSA